MIETEKWRNDKNNSIEIMEKEKGANENTKQH